jgi:hypothetical protein
MNEPLIVFTYAPAGLGHLRVVNSLAEGLKSPVSPILLGASDKGIAPIHKFTSINPFARSIMEWVQHGKAQDIYAYFYRNYLKSRTGRIYSEIVEAIGERLEVPKKIVFCCTHFDIGHQLSVIRGKLEKELNAKIYVVLQVTDDSPQSAWYVPNMDLIFVPSEYTKKELEAYAKKNKLGFSKIEVLPYPVNPFLAEKLSDSRFGQKVQQLNKSSDVVVNVALPISGAAVSMDFYKHLINKLNTKSRSYIFHIVSRLAPFTKSFLNDVKTIENVKIYCSSNDKEVVDLYDQLYKKEIISLEITKPSEQAFKALLTTEDIGGSLLLFSKPIGRQEYDNLEFMRRHQMLLTKEEQQFLWQKARNSESISDASIIELFENKKHIRGIELPMGSNDTANFIWWCLNEGIFEKMLEQGRGALNTEIETQSNGVELYWKRVNELVGN